MSQETNRTHVAEVVVNSGKLRLIVQPNTDGSCQATVFDERKGEVVWKDSFALASQAQHECIKAAAKAAGHPLGQVEFDPV